MLIVNTLKKTVLPAVFLSLCSCFTVSAADSTESDSKRNPSPGLEWEVDAGIGYNSNIYRAPSDPYIDYAKKCTVPSANCVGGYVMVYPQIKSGVFIPLELNLDYSKNLAANSMFLASYKAEGEFYAQSQYHNANSYGNKLTVGDQWMFSANQDRQQSLYVGGLLEYKKRLYLDRDTGADQETAAGVDISKRYTYDSYGLESEFEGKQSDFQYAVNAAVEKRNYEDPVVVSQYDHTYYTAGGKAKYKLSPSTKLSAGYDYYMYNYVERPSRSLDGRLLVSNPTRKYVLNNIGVTLRHRFSKAWLVYLDYDYKTRTDKYQGYDDYTKNQVKMRLHYVINKNNRLKLSYAYWKRDYPYAYAFDNQAINISKKYDGSEVKLIWKTSLDKRKTIVVDVDYYNENSTDLRYDYSSYQTSVFFQWQF